MKKAIKYIIFTLLIGVIFGVNSGVYAFEVDYGLFCAYKNSDGTYYYFKYHGGSKEVKFNFEQNFDGGEFQDVPSLGVAIEAGRPGKLITDDSELNWLREKGLLNSNGDFICPSNPFGTTLGSPIESECGESGCHIYDVPTEYRTYTCNYVGQRTKNQLNMTFIHDADGTRWNVTYPDGTSKTLTGSDLNGNLWPGDDCNDIYYIASEKRIKVAVDANEGVTNNAILSGLCDTYQQYQIEHFCSGTCTYPEMVCSSSSSIFETDVSGCPKVLRPIIVFIKKLVFNTLQIFVPILLIVMGTIDFVKATAAMDDKGGKEAISKFIRRIIAAVLMFFIVTIVSLVMNMFAKTDVGDQSGWQACWNDID